MPLPVYLPCTRISDLNWTDEDEMIVGLLGHDYTSLEILAFSLVVCQELQLNCVQKLQLNCLLK